MLTLLLNLILLAEHHVAIKISPLTMMVGNKLTITCIVDRRPENRALSVWLVDGDIPVDVSVWPLDGANAAKTNIFEKMPSCDTVSAICAIVTNTGETEQATARVNVHGCDSNQHKLRKP